MAIVEVVPLIGEQHAVRLGLAQLIGEPPGDMLIIVRIGVGQRRHFDQLGAAQPQHVLLFLALGFRDHDQRAVAARAGDDRKADPGIAGGAFHHEAAGLEVAALLGLQDHPFAGAVLHRLAGIHELGLAENGAAGRFGSALQLDERRVADRFDDVVVDVHVLEICRLRCRSGSDPK